MIYEPIKGSGFSNNQYPVYLPDSKHLNTSKLKRVYFLTVTFFVALNVDAKSINTESLQLQFLNDSI